MHHTTPHRARRASMRGFTLIELLTVIAIIGILAAILIPTLGAVRNRARSAQCVSRLREWGGAVRLFANDYKGFMPLMIDVGADGADGSSSRFYEKYLAKVPDGIANATAMEYFAVCPTIDRSGLTPGDSARRYYNFIRPGGVKEAAANTSMGGWKTSKVTPYVMLEKMRSPSRLFLMIETLPGGSGDTIKSTSYISDINTKVKPIITNTNKDLIRHGGSVNVLFGDGSVRGQRLSDIEFKPGSGTSLTTDPRFNL